MRDAFVPFFVHGKRSLTMAFGNFWRGGRERFGERDRDRERGRMMGSDWREDERERWRDERYGASDRDRDEYGAREGRYGSPEWESGEAYGDRSRSYGAQGYGSQDYGTRQGYGGGGPSYGRERYRGQGSESGRGWGSEERESDYPGTRYGGSEYDYRGGNLYGGGFSRGSRGSYGAGSYGRGSYEMPGGYGEGAYGRGAYGGFGAEGYSQEQGMYRGRGPRNYRRSDERIREDVCDCLTDDPRLDASNVEVTVKDCEVTLAGSVNRREDKRRAEDLVERISGVKDVRNNLRVSQEAGTERTGALGQQGQGQQQGQAGQSPRH
jgi:osmotically-inducible protein OsmY